MDAEFMLFLKSYIDGEFKELVETKKGKMPFDVSTPEKACESMEALEKEILNVNINLLYAYHQWLKNNGIIKQAITKK